MAGMALLLFDLLIVPDAVSELATPCTQLLSWMPGWGCALCVTMTRDESGF
jgi:hypothetical protein